MVLFTGPASWPVRVVMLALTAAGVGGDHGLAGAPPAGGLGTSRWDAGLAPLQGTEGGRRFCRRVPRGGRGGVHPRRPSVAGVADHGVVPRHDPHFGRRSSAPRLLSLIHISEPTRLGMISYAVFCL